MPHSLNVALYSSSVFLSITAHITTHPPRVQLDICCFVLLAAKWQPPVLKHEAYVEVQKNAVSQVSLETSSKSPGNPIELCIKISTFAFYRRI